MKNSRVHTELICRTVVVSIVVIGLVIGSIGIYGWSVKAIETVVKHKGQIEAVWDSNSSREFLENK